MKIITISILILILLIPLASSQMNEVNNFRIGYSPEKLFNSETGMPSYLAGETIWLHVDNSQTIELKNPQQNTVVKSEINENPTSIYEFKNNDQLGTWSLIVNEKTYQIELSNQQLDAQNNIVEFAFVNKSLEVTGSIVPNFKGIPSQSEVIISKKRDKDSIIIPTKLSIEDMITIINIEYQMEGNEARLHIQPYLGQIGNKEEYSEIGFYNIYTWAELTSEVTLVKKTGNSRFITYLDEPITESTRTYLPITNTPQSGLNITIPSLGNIDKPWTIPLKYGKTLLSIYLEFEGQLFVNRIPIIILEDKIIINPDLIIPTESFGETINYKGILELESDMDIDFLLISKINGIDKIFYFSEKPSISTIQITNELDNKRIENYKLTFEQNIESIKINGTTYLVSNNILVNPTLVINSFQMNKQDINPSRIKLEEGATINILANIGIANIQLIDSIGSLSGNGELTIQRLDVNKDEIFIIEWNGENVEILLPKGKYSAKLEIDGRQGETEFEIDREKKDVIIFIDSLFGVSTGILMFILMTIITVEIGIIYSVWKRNLRIN